MFKFGGCAELSLNVCCMNKLNRGIVSSMCQSYTHQTLVIIFEVAFDFTKFAALVIPLQVICPRKIHAQNHFLSMILDSWIGTRIKKNWHIYDKKIFRKNIGTWKNILYLVGVGSQIPDSRKKESEWVLPEWLVYLSTFCHDFSQPCIFSTDHGTTVFLPFLGEFGYNTK